jgi:hypothetical protein
MLAIGLRLSHEAQMQTFADQVIDALGGTSEVSRATLAPTSTVHSWRKIGIPDSRLAHLRLLAKERGIELPEQPADAAKEPKAA